jgi:hypothetical protein
LARVGAWCSADGARAHDWHSRYLYFLAAHIDSSGSQRGRSVACSLPGLTSALRLRARYPGPGAAAVRHPSERLPQRNAELDEADELDVGDPTELARDYRRSAGQLACHWSCLSRRRPGTLRAPSLCREPSPSRLARRIRRRSRCQPWCRRQPGCHCHRGTYRESAMLPGQGQRPHLVPVPVPGEITIRVPFVVFDPGSARHLPYPRLRSMVRRPPSEGFTARG